MKVWGPQISHKNKNVKKNDISNIVLLQFTLYSILRLSLGVLFVASVRLSVVGGGHDIIC